MRPEIEPFATLYDHFIKGREPMISSKCSLGQAYLYDIGGYLLDEVYHSVKNFKSEFLLNWTDIINAIQTLKPNHTVIFPIAFRKNGVDGPYDIGLRPENGIEYFHEIYRSKKVYLLVCVADDTDVHISLYNIYDDIVNHFDLFTTKSFPCYYQKKYRGNQSFIRDFIYELRAILGL